MSEKPVEGEDENTEASEIEILPESLWSRCKHAILGPARNVNDPGIAQHISLAAFLAWIGLGADGMSSSAYGPDEAFRALGQYVYLAPFLVIATAVTIFVISYSYTKIIEHFPEGGGGYLVATKLVGDWAGVLSGAALLVDYVLTITVSIAAGADAVFSLLPLEMHVYKMPVAVCAIFLLGFLNLRGVKESVKVLVPIFMVFLATHVFMILYGVLSHLGDTGAVVAETTEHFQGGVSSLGGWGLFLIFLRAYSMGGGTYTGIEAVSNGLGILREPKIATGKRTMLYMAVSLAVMAGGLLLCYMLLRLHPVEGQTLNATLASALFSSWTLGGIAIGKGLVWAIMFSAAMLLLVAAQTGFIDGPRVMANMASDLWLPRRFSTLSDRLTIQKGVILMGLAALLTLAYTGGDVRVLVVMYSINVFVTFALSQLGMCRFWIGNFWKSSFLKSVRNLFLHGVGFLLCAAILIIMIFEKITEGGWITVVVTSALVALCVAIRRHYRGVAKLVQEMGETFGDIPLVPAGSGMSLKLDETKPTAVILVGGGHSRTGVHTLLTVFRLFPHTFHNVVFVSVGVINSEFFKNDHALEDLRRRTESSLQFYVDMARGLGIPAKSEYRVGTDVVQEASQLCVRISHDFSHSVIFGSELVFQEPRWYHRFLHNETAYSIQQRLRFAGLSVVILPILLFDHSEREKKTSHVHDSPIYRDIECHSETSSEPPQSKASK